MGALCGLYDKYLLYTLHLNKLTIQCYYNFYQCLMMGLMILLLWYPHRQQVVSFRWKWAIPLISIFLSAADYVYFCSLQEDGALISVVSMVRRSSVLVSFMIGAVLFHEKNLRSKAIDLALVLFSMIFLYLGTK